VFLQPYINSYNGRERETEREREREKDPNNSKGLIIYCRSILRIQLIAEVGQREREERNIIL
jgi:hypothetical protein